VGFFLFPTIKKQLVGKTLIQKSLKSMWEGAARSSAKEDFTTEFRQWYEQCKKCVRLSGRYDKKSLKNTLLKNQTVLKKCFLEIKNKHHVPDHV
jgi:uncharacterized protein YukE